MNYRIKNHLINAFVFTAILLITSCSSESENTPVEVAQGDIPVQGDYKITANQFESSGMKLGKIEMKEFYDVVRAKGMIDVPPEYRTSVSTYFGGNVKELRLLTGEEVKKGQTLFVLENPDYVQMQQDYLEAKGQLSYLKSDYERQKNLVEDNVSSQKKFLKAESDYRVTNVKVESLGKKLKMMNIDPNSLTMENITSTIRITSPLDGFITAINITKGVYLNPSQTAISIVNTDHLHLELDIFEKDISKVKVGQTIKFKIQEEGNTEYEGTVHLVNKNVDIEKRTIGIHGHLIDDQVAKRLSPGMYVEADIYTASDSKPSLPREATVDLDGNLYVLVLETSENEEYVFREKEIKAGASNREFIEITNTDDFTSDAQFLISGAFNLIRE